MNTVKCTNCGNNNINTNIRCEKCGEQLISNEELDSMNPIIQEDTVSDAKIDSVATIFSGIVITLVGVIFSGVASMFVFKGADSATKMVGIPFLIYSMAILINSISMIMKGININRNTNDYVNGKLDIDKVEKSEKNFKRMQNIVKNIHIFAFLLFWFGILIVFDMNAIKSWSDGGNQKFFFSIIFWITGIYILINHFKKNK
ncbi:MAG: hypothetical protein PUB18_05010 [bacterium]|nr:hypothetical protein [bacterium]